MIWSATSYRSRSPWAAASPFKDSLTTAAGSLRNFRIWLVSTAILVFLLSVKDLAGGRAGALVFVGDRFHDRSRDRQGVGEEVEEDCRRGRAHEAGDAVAGYVLRPEGRAAGDRLHQLGAEGTRRVDRRSGDGAEDEDDPDHRAADHDAGELRRRLRVHNAQDGEDEQPGAECLSERGLHVVARRLVDEFRLAHAEQHSVVPEHAPDRECAKDGAGVLRGPVGGDFLPREALRHGQAQRDGRVDMATRHLPDRVDEGRDDEAEGEADRKQVSLRHRRHRLAREGERGDDRTRAHQDQRRRAEELGQRPLWHRMHVSVPLYLTSVRQCRTDFTNRSLLQTVCQQAIWSERPNSRPTVPATPRGRPRFSSGHQSPPDRSALTFGFHVQADRDRDYSGRFPDLANRADVVGPPGQNSAGGFFMPIQKNGNDQRGGTARRIVIYDTTLRDGAQGPAVTFSPADKARTARTLDGLGFDYVEGGFPGSNPKDEELFAELAEHPLKRARLAAFGATRRAGGTCAADANLQALPRS